MSSIINGLLGGGLAGLVAVLVTAVVSSGEPLLPGASRGVSAIAGVSYGVVAGGALVALELSVLNLLSVPPATGTVMAITLLWAGLLFFLTVIAEVGLGRDRAGFTGLLVYHGLFGLALGAWIRLTWIT